MGTVVDRFEWKGGPFRGRSHIVNHIDMLFGLGDKEMSSGREKRVCLNVMSRHGDARVGLMWKLTEESLAAGRRWIQYQSLFASSWEQLYPMHGEEYFSPDDLEGEDDLLGLLRECVSIWVEEDHFYGGDYDSFCSETSLVMLLGSWDPVRADRIIVRHKPTASLENLPVSVNDRRVMAARHEVRTEWLAYSDRICRNEHVLHELCERQDGVCAVCGHELGSSFVVHHIDYDHECSFAHLGVRWTRPGTRVQPDCERCHGEHPDLFEDCLSRLRAVHPSCNYLIEATL